MMNLCKTMKCLFLTGLVIGCALFSPKGLGAMEKHGKDITICNNNSDWDKKLFIRVATGDNLNEHILFYGAISHEAKETIHLDQEDANLTIRGFESEDEMYKYYVIMSQKKKKFLGSLFKFSVSDVEYLVNASKFYYEIYNVSGISEITIKYEGSFEIGWRTSIMWKK